MNPMTIFIFIFSINVLVNYARPASSAPELLDACSGGKAGNPGAHLRLGPAVLDEIYGQAMSMLTRALRSMTIPEFPVPLGGGTLTIKNTRVTEVKMGGYNRTMVPSARIRSVVKAERMVGVGQWVFSRMYQGVDRPVASGAFRAMVINAEITLINELGRTEDAKPTMKTSECTSYLGQFRVQIEGFGKDPITIQQCDNLLCKKIRTFFENAVCDAGRKLIVDKVDKLLETFPTRIDLGPTNHSFILDYGLLMNEPKVTEKSVLGNLKGEVQSRDPLTVLFYAHDLCIDTSHPNITFSLSDYVFNTLLHHVHVQQYRFSAQDLLKNRDQLKLQCSSNGSVSSMCLGSVFGINVDGSGDLIFKSKWPLQVMVGSERSIFGSNGGMIEAYGKAGLDGNRELLGRADVQWMRGVFTPEVKECNITGHVTLSNLRLVAQPPTSPQSKSNLISESSLSNLSQLAIPVLTEVFNSFLLQFAQFPIPLVDGVTCDSTDIQWKERTIQVHTSFRSLP